MKIETDREAIDILNDVIRAIYKGALSDTGEEAAYLGDELDKVRQWLGRNE